MSCEVALTKRRGAHERERARHRHPRHPGVTTNVNPTSTGTAPNAALAGTIAASHIVPTAARSVNIQSDDEVACGEDELAPIR